MCSWFPLGSTSPFSTGGHVLQSLFPKPSDGGRGRRAQSVSALLLVSGIMVASFSQHSLASDWLMIKFTLHFIQLGNGGQTEDEHALRKKSIRQSYFRILSSWPL